MSPFFLYLFGMEENERIRLVPRHEDHVFDTTARRWLVLIAFCAIGTMCTVFQYSYSAISYLSSPYYGNVNPLAYSALSAIYLVFPVPLSFLSSWVMQRHGLFWNCIIGSILLSVSGWVRYAGSYPGESYFAVAFVGQSIGACSAAFLGVNPIALIANNWFARTERATATALMVIAHLSGAVLCYIVAPYIALDGVGVPTLFFGQALFATVFAILVAVLIRNVPSPLPTPAAAAMRPRPAPPSFHAVLKHLFTSRSYVAMFVLYGLAFAVFHSAFVFVWNVMPSLGYSQVRTQTHTKHL